MAQLTQDEIIALVLTKLRTAGGGGSGSGSGGEGGSGSEVTGGMTPEELEQFNNLLAKFAALQQVAFEQLSTNALFASMVEAGTITVDNAFANYMAVLSAVVTNLNANKITADYINVQNLQAVVTTIQEANIDTLFADYVKTTSVITEGLTANEILAAAGKFFTLIATSLSAQDIQAFVISSNHVQFETACIKNAAIESVSASKLTAGTINTSQVAIKSGDQTSMVISDGLIQIQDDTYVRVQIGRVAPNTYDMRVWDTSGNLMWSASGITAAAIKSAIIVDDMIAPNANISSSKINISSLVTAINENGNIQTDASNITIDAEGQTLDLWFSTMESWKSSQSSATSQLQTSINTINGRLSTFVSQTDIATITSDISDLTTNLGNVSDAVTQIQTDYSALNQTVSGLQTTVSSAVTTANTASTKATQVEQTVNGLSTTVSSVQTRVNSNTQTLNDYANSSFVNTEAFNEALTEFRQAADSITLTVTNNINNSNTLVNFNKWFTFTNDGLTIGSSDNNISLIIDNTKIQFVRTVNDTTTVLGEWNGTNFYTKNIVIGESMSLKFGNFEMLQEDDTFIIRSL